MKGYCLDTSGFSNPLELMPDDIHVTMWTKVKDVIIAGKIYFNAEIHQELKSLKGSVGQCLMDCAHHSLLEVGDDKWDWKAYIKTLDVMKARYKGCISEYNGGRKSTVGLNDISIMALASTLRLPLISMESDSVQVSVIKKRIPEICRLESVRHLTFNQFLRAENILI